MRQRSAERPLRQRVIALVAAYAVALSSLVASYGLAYAAAATVALPDSVTALHLGYTYTTQAYTRLPITRSPQCLSASVPSSSH